MKKGQESGGAPFQTHPARGGGWNLLRGTGKRDSNEGPRHITPVRDATRMSSHKVISGSSLLLIVGKG